MAFATSNVKVESMGSTWKTGGKWTGVVGDSTGTIKVPGAVVDSAVFHHNLSSGGPVGPASWSYSSTGGVSTVTIQNQLTVTNGSFEIHSR